MIRQNLHCHTTFDDGKDSAEAMVLAAEAAGLKSLGISLHCPIQGEEDWCCPAQDELRFIDEVHRLREQYMGRLEIWCGLEYDLEAVRRKAPPYDYIIGSCHILDGLYIDYDMETAEKLIAHFGGADRAAEAYYGRVTELAGFEEIDIIGHFDLPTKYNERSPLYDTASSAYRDAAFAAMEKLNAAGKIFEINSGAISRGWRTTPYPAPELLKHLHAIGGRICISSDAHAASGITCAFEQSEAIARACGFTELWELTQDGFRPAAF